MPNDYSYSISYRKRKGPQIKMGQGMRRVEPEPEPEQPGVIKPKIGFKEPPPRPSDTEIHQRAETAEVKI